MDRVREVNSGSAEQERYRARQRFEEVAKTVFVPVNDDLVRHQLRQQGLPVEITSESRADRRERLRQFRVEQKIGGNTGRQSNNGENTNRRSINGEPTNGGEPEPVELQVTEASPELVTARKQIAQKYRAEKGNIIAHPFGGELYASQTGFARPVSALRFLDADRIVVGDYAGEVAVLNLADDMAYEFQDSKINTGRIGGLCARENLFISGDLSGACHLYSVQTKVDWQRTWEGNGDRVTGVDFHYTGQWFVSAYTNGDWRLWDVNNATALQIQRGGRGKINFSQISADGCVLAAGGDDSQVSLWDLRNGKSFATLANHADAVLAMAWHPDPGQAYTMLTGGADNRCLVWDLRSIKEPVHTLYAHINAITDIAFDGVQVMTTSLDGMVKVWGNENYSLVKQFRSGTKLTSGDLRNGKLVTGRWDRQVDMYL